MLENRLQSMIEAAPENESEKMKLDGDTDERTLLASGDETKEATSEGAHHAASAGKPHAPAQTQDAMGRLDAMRRF